MSLDPYLQRLHDSPIASAIREGADTFPWIESIHVLAVVILIGTIAIVDIRLLGYPSHRRSARKLMTELLPFTWAAFGVAVIAGALLFTSNAVAYAHNLQFRAKMLVLVAAGLNMAIFHLTANRRIVDWDESLLTPRAARIAGATSLGLWVVMCFLGRWIGFTLF